MERFIVVLLFFSLTSCQSLINEDIIFEKVVELEDVQEIFVIENEIKPELVWDHLEKNATSRNYKINNTSKLYLILKELDVKFKFKVEFEITCGILLV
mgnify:CR=1 FL=1